MFSKNGTVASLDRLDLDIVVVLTLFNCTQHDDIQICFLGEIPESLHRRKVTGREAHLEQQSIESRMVYNGCLLLAVVQDGCREKPCEVVTLA